MKVMRFIRGLAVLAALLPAAASAQTVLAVTKGEDDGTPGTLRWAIEENNRNPGAYRIEIAPLRIKPLTLLPPIKGPAVINGSSNAVIDGSAIVDVTNVRSCPGENPEQFGPNVRTLQKPGLAVVDTTDVEITGLEVRNFCIGILSWRSARSHFHRNRLVNNIGGAGIMFTGDDGAGNPAARTSVNGLVEFNTFIDNGDGLELSRGTEFTTVAYNVFAMTAVGLTPSQGIEILASNNDAIFNNFFTGFSDGLQVGGSGHVLRGNTVMDAAYGITVSGSNVRIVDNRISGVRMGIGVRGTGHILSRNHITDVGRDIPRCNAGGICNNNPRYAAIKLPVDLGVDGSTPDGAPELVAWDGQIATGVLMSQPDTNYAIEFFANGGFVGHTKVKTNAEGRADISAHVVADGVLTATATGPAGTSEFSNRITRTR